MIGWGDALLELDYSIRRLEAEMEHGRLVQIALGAALRPEKASRGRRLARRMGNLMVGLGCRLGQGLSAGPPTNKRLGRTEQGTLWERCAWYHSVDSHGKQTEEIV